MADASYNHRNYRRTLEMWRKQLPNCAICGGPTTNSPGDPNRITVDHIRGVRSFEPGTSASVISALSNLRPAHTRCNATRAKSQTKRARAEASIQRDPRY